MLAEFLGQFRKLNYRYLYCICLIIKILLSLLFSLLFQRAEVYCLPKKKMTDGRFENVLLSLVQMVAHDLMNIPLRIKAEVGITKITKQCSLKIKKRRRKERRKRSEYHKYVVVLGEGSSTDITTPCTLQTIGYRPENKHKIISQIARIVIGKKLDLVQYNLNLSATNMSVRNGARRR